MAKIEHYKRRCGNTTRQVDEWIQDLFDGKDVKIEDHAAREGNTANRYAEKIFLDRLANEHGIFKGKNNQLEFNGGIYHLLPF